MIKYIRELIGINHPKPFKDQYKKAMLNGVRHGLSIGHWNNGNRRYLTKWFNGKMSGLAIYWNQNDCISLVVQKKNISDNGIRIDFRYGN